MILLFELKSMAKDVRVKGCVTAKTRVRRGLYDVLIGDDHFPSLCVAEPHINSPMPQRGLDIECGPDAFRLETVIRKGMSAGNCTITLKPARAAAPPADPRAAQFEVIPQDVYAYVTLRGLVFERSGDRPDGLLWVLTRSGGGERGSVGKSERPLLGPSRDPFLHYLAAHALLRLEEVQEWREYATSQEEVEVPIALAGGDYGQLRKKGSLLEITFPDHAEFADSLVSMLTSGHRCLIPVGMGDRAADGDSEAAPSEKVVWIKVGF